MFGSPNCFSNEMKKIQNNLNEFDDTHITNDAVSQVLERLHVVEAEGEEQGQDPPLAPSSCSHMQQKASGLPFGTGSRQSGRALGSTNLDLNPSSRAYRCRASDFSAMNGDKNTSDRHGV